MNHEITLEGFVATYVGPRASMHLYSVSCPCRPRCSLMLELYVSSKDSVGDRLRALVDHHNARQNKKKDPHAKG